MIFPLAGQLQLIPSTSFTPPDTEAAAVVCVVLLADDAGAVWDPLLPESIERTSTCEDVPTLAVCTPEVSPVGACTHIT